MSVISIPIPRVEGSVSEQASPAAPGNVLTANEMSGYMPSAPREDDVQKCLAPISDNARARANSDVARSKFIS